MSSLKKLKEAVVAVRKVPPKRTGKPSKLSSEYVEATDAEDESTSSESSVEIAPKVNSTKTKDSPTLPSKRPNVSAQTKASSIAPKPASVASSDSDSDSGSESGSESESADSSSSDDSTSDGLRQSKRKGSDAIRTNTTSVAGAKRPLDPQRLPAKPKASFRPPNGFESIPSSSTSSTVASDMFSRSSLGGKQIWHITAPSAIPVDMIKEVSLESVAKGEAALHHRGTDYGFVVNGEGSQTPKRILVAGAGNSYRSAPMEIAQTLQLQQLVKLPPLQLNQSRSSGSSQGSTTAFAPPKKPVRQQPQNLRMRFGPIGDQIGESGKIGFESSSDESSVGHGRGSPEFRIPQGVKEHTKPGKRKHSDVNGGNINGVSPAQPTCDGKDGKRKKAKHDSGHHMAREPSSSILEPSMNLGSPSDAHSGTPVQSQSQETPSKGKESDQERKDRKAREKRKAQKAKDRQRKDSNHDLKNGENLSDRKEPESIAA